MGKKQKPGKPAKRQKPGKGASKIAPGLSEPEKASEDGALPNKGSETSKQAQKGNAASKYLVSLQGATKDQPLCDEARGKVAGLVNLGNTCYMNSCIQVTDLACIITACYMCCIILRCSASRVGT